MSLTSGRARESILRQAKLVAVLMFCLVNPVAGWAYLATNRARWNREDAPIIDTVKRTRVAVLPLRGRAGSIALAERWLDAMLSGLSGFDTLETVTLPENAPAGEAEHDALRWGADLAADLVVDASYAIVEGELRLFVCLLSVAERAVVSSRGFDGLPDELGRFCDETVVSVFRALGTK